MLTQWRIMGMWQDGRRFLVVLGKSARDCLRQFDDALDDLNYSDAQRIRYLWFERWDPGTELREPSWTAVKAIPVHRIRLLKAQAANVSPILALVA